MSKLTFDSATINGTAVAASDFVYGNGEFEEYGWDAENNTANGFHHIDRITRRGRGRMVLYGNKTDLVHPTTIPSLSYAIVMTSTTGESITRSGACRAVYRDSAQNTEIQFDTDPVPPATIA